MLTVICPPETELSELIMREDGIRQVWQSVYTLQLVRDYISGADIPANSTAWRHNGRYLSQASLTLLVTGTLSKTSSHDGMTNDEPRPFQQFLDANPKAVNLPLIANQQRDVLGPIGSVTSINLARIGEPERLGYFARNQQRTASGQTHPTFEQAEADIIAWAANKPVKYTQHAVVPLASIFPNGIPKPPTPFQQWITRKILSLAQIIRGRKPGKRY